jgi:TonB family protein
MLVGLHPRRVVVYAALLFMIGLAPSRADEQDEKAAPAASRSPSLSVAVLLEQLQSQDAPTRARAALALIEAEPTDEISEAVEWASTRDDDKDVREAAALALAHLRPTPALIIDKHAKLRDSPGPKYPPAAFVKKIEGTVTVEVLINAWGKVVRTELRTSVPGLDAAALAAVRKWTFEPAESSGKPVAERTVVPVVFRIF